jgi:predicted acyltransferase
MDLQEQAASREQPAPAMPEDPGLRLSGDPSLPPASRLSPPASRLVSLDAFRGLTIFGMLLVNNAALGAATPKQLTHAPWNGGIYFADFVFPWFLFIVGVAIPWAAASFRKKGLPWWRYFLKIPGRTAALFLLGCLINSSIAKRPVLGLGVLQLIGLAYCVGALLSPLPVAARLSVATALLVGHWAAIRFIPVPGLGAGRFTETENLIYYLNQQHLQPLGLKGLVSIVPTAAMVLIGTGVGEVLRRESIRPLRKLGLLAAGGLGLALIGWWWSHDLPFNKPVWTAPYILFTAGCGSLVLCVLYWLVDLRGWRWWVFPLVVFGSNAILAYVAPILVKIHILQEWTVEAGSKVTLQQALLGASVEHYGPVTGGWVYTLGYIFVWWLILLWFYHKQVFLRV